MKRKVVPHVGVLLSQAINRAGMSQKELSVRTGTSEKHISTVINCSKGISASFANKLDIALGNEKGYWAQRQADYDRYQVELEEENGIAAEETDILKPLKDIIHRFLEIGVMHNDCGDAEKVLQLRDILRVNNLTAIPQITYNAAYRAQIKTSTAVDPFILFAWQRLCEIQTEKAVINSEFDSKKLFKCIPKIKSQMFENDPDAMIVNLKSIFANCGVAFDVVLHFRGAPVQGFIKQKDNGKVILCVTIRGKGADRFWFSLFHEVGHLLNEDLNTRFVDFDTVKTEMEDRADSFARDILIDPTLYKSFISSGKYHDLDDIKTFARIAAVPYWIVIGRLHNDEWLDWSYFAREIPSFEWENA